MRFLVIPCKSAYTCILGTPFSVTLDVVAYIVHLKMKYHNTHDKIVTICDILSIGKRKHKTLKHKQDGKAKQSAMEVNMACLSKRLGDMVIRYLGKGVMFPSCMI